MRDLGSHITVKRLIAEATNTTSPSSVVIDRATVNADLFDGMTLAMYAGAGGITFTPTNFLALRLEDSDDGTTYANVGAGAALLGANAAAPGGQAPDTNGYVRLLTSAKASADADPFKVSYVGNRRFLRASVVYGGTHASGTTVGLWGVLGFGANLPSP